MVEQAWDQKFQEFLNSTECTQASLEYLDLADAKVSNRDLAHNLRINAYRQSLTGKVLWASGRKNRDLILQVISEQKAQKEQISEIENLSRVVRSQRSDLKRANQKIEGLESEIKALRQEYLNRRPLSKQDVEELVLKISEQPKFIEQQTEALTVELSAKVDKIEALIHKLERVVTG